jgi:hypothetical protein
VEGQELAGLALCNWLLKLSNFENRFQTLRCLVRETLAEGGRGSGIHGTQGHGGAKIMICNMWGYSKVHIYIHTILSATISLPPPHLTLYLPEVRPWLAGTGRGGGRRRKWASLPTFFLREGRVGGWEQGSALPTTCILYSNAGKITIPPLKGIVSWDFIPFCVFLDSNSPWPLIRYLKYKSTTSITLRYLTCRFIPRYGPWRRVYFWAMGQCA